MSLKKKDIIFLYCLKWRNKPAQWDDKDNLVGILDVPGATLEWKSFKSYLLKNCGVIDENVTVSYEHLIEGEKVIRSQDDCKAAMETFRRMAFKKQTITLWMDYINEGKENFKLDYTKFMARDVWLELPKRTKAKQLDKPPEWFLEYMKKFKEELLEEINALYSTKPHQMSLQYARKLKTDRQRSRKAPLLFGDNANDKEVSKSAKTEKKLESKLEKLEHKTFKIKAKKIVLRGSSDSDVGKSSSKNSTARLYLGAGRDNFDLAMNATALKKGATPHMIGGESYCQTWEVTNSGSLPWTLNTELRYAWGSQVLKPLVKEVPCPLLAPGENGVINVPLEIPKTPGTYECYWHFYHEGRRFGNWLGCEIIVDEAPVKNVSYVPGPTYDVINICDAYELVLPTSWSKAQAPNIIDGVIKPNGEIDPINVVATAEIQSTEDPGDAGNSLRKDDDNVQEVGQEPRDETVDGGKDKTKTTDAGAFALTDSDNHSIISISSDSSANTATSDDFVVLKSTKKEVTIVESLPPKTEEKVNEVGNALAKMSVVDDDTWSTASTIDEGMVPIKSDICKETNNLINIADLPTFEEVLDEEKNVRVKLEPRTEMNTVQQTPIDLSNKSLTVEGDNDESYAYVHYKGRKIPIAKKHLSRKYLETAESVPEAALKTLDQSVVEGKNEEPTVKDQRHGMNSFSSLSVNNGSNRDDFGGDCCGTAAPSMSSSVNENRFFVFPQYYPGYEVVAPASGNYVEPNVGNVGGAFQPIYGYNTLGEVMVNDCTTGLNYSACVRYPVHSPRPPRSCPGSIHDSVPACLSPSPPSESHGSPLRTPSNSPSVNICGDRCTFERSGGAFSPPQTTPAHLNRNSEDVRGGGGNTGGGGRVGVPDLLSGASVVATSAMNTARSVLNMFVPPRSGECGRWQNGHWISTNPESLREKSLRALYEMGFYDRDLNATLLARYNDDINAVIEDLVQYTFFRLD